MRRRVAASAICRCRSEEGFTLVEVLVALALVTVTAAIGFTLVRAGLTTLSNALASARRNSAAILFDRSARAAFDGFSPAFWGRPPELRRLDDGFVIAEAANDAGYQAAFLFVGGGTGTSASARTLIVRWGARTVAIPGVRGLAFAPIAAPDGRIAGYEALLRGEAGELQRCTLIFEGGYL